MTIREIADWIAPLANANIGVNLFAGALMQNNNPRKATVILSRGPNVVELDGSNVRRKVIQFLSFAQTYPEAEEEAYKYFNILDQHGSVDLSSGVILSIVGAEPHYLGVGMKDRHEFSLNMTFNYKPKG
jgi:hypothetical protein